MKIRLPSLASLRRPAAPADAPNPGATAVAPAAPIGGLGDRMRLMSRRLRSSAGWVFLAVFVFFAFVWISLPTRALAWRIGQQARQAGYLIDIEDMSVRPWGSATLYNVTWTYSPSHPGQIPHQLILDAVDVDFSVLKYLLLGSIDVEVDTVLDDAPIHAEYTRSSSESTIKVDVTELPLSDVPKLQQALGAPLRGLFALHVDLTLPENLFANAEGSITIECASCSIGDGEELLFIPGSSGITAKGMTIPEIDLGTLTGKLTVKEGKATAEEFQTKSEDIELVLTGDMPLKDPFSKSEFAFNMKLLVTQALQDKSEALRFAVQTSTSAKMDPPDEGWLGFKLRGTAGRPRFLGIKTKTAEERLLEKRQKNAEREAAKRARAKARSTKKTETPEKDALERNVGPDSAAGDTGNSDKDERMPEVEVRPTELPPPPEPEPEPQEEPRGVEERPADPPVMDEPPRPEFEGGQGQGQGDGQDDGRADGQDDGRADDRADGSQEGPPEMQGDAPQEGEPSLDGAQPSDAPVG